MSDTKIGFIGLGLMGSAMVENLQARGYNLTIVANRSRTAIDAAVARGANEVGTAREVAEQSDIIMLCMDTSANVEARMRGADGIIAGLQNGAVVVDFGTSLPASTRTLAQEVAAAGGQMLDAPLGRTPAHAQEGKLNIMAAGDKAAYDKIEPVLKDMGENVFHLGASGSGHTVKLLNNFLGMSIANAVAELYAVADLQGVDRQSVYNVISAGPLHSMMMDFVSKYALEGSDEALAFSIKNGAKDIGYYAQMLEDAGTSSSLVSCANHAMKEAIANGKGEDMIPIMMDHYKEKLGN